MKNVGKVVSLKIDSSNFYLVFDILSAHGHPVHAPSVKSIQEKVSHCESLMYPAGLRESFLFKKETHRSGLINFYLTLTAFFSNEKVRI